MRIKVCFNSKFLSITFPVSLELFPEFFCLPFCFCFFKQRKNLTGVQLRTPKVCLDSAFVEITIIVLLFLMFSAGMNLTMQLCNEIVTFGEQISEYWKRLVSRNLKRCLNLENHEQVSPVSHTYEIHFHGFQ